MHAHIGRTRRTKLLAAAGAAALVVGLGSIGAPAALADSASPTPAAAAATPTTFTIGMTTDIDSANPFTGIVAEAYEVFQLMYPTLTEYAADGLQHRAGHRRLLDGVRRQEDLDLQDPPGPEVVATASR